MLITIATLIADGDDAMFLLSNHLRAVEDIHTATSAGVLKYANAALMVDPRGIEDMANGGAMWAVASVVLPDLSMQKAAEFVNRVFNLPVHESQFIQQESDSVVGTALVLGCGLPNCEDCAQRAALTKRRFVALVVFPKSDGSSVKDVQRTSELVSESYARAERAYVLTQLANAITDGGDASSDKKYESVTVVRVSNGKAIEVDPTTGEDVPSDPSADAPAPPKGVLKNAGALHRKSFN